MTRMKRRKHLPHRTKHLGIIISSRYEFYFLICISRLTISLSEPAHQNQRKRSVIMFLYANDSLIERVGILGNHVKTRFLRSDTREQKNDS